MKNIWLVFLFLAIILFFSGCVNEPAKPDGNQSIYTNTTQVNQTVQNNTTQIPSGCAYNNPSCDENHSCENNSCMLKFGCQYNNPVCNLNYDCVNNNCVLKSESKPNHSDDGTNSCASQYSDTEHMDIFDSHVHIPSTISASEIISEMDKAGVSMSLLYSDASSSLGAISKYPGRFITFVDTPDSPQPSTWLTEGQAFVTSADEQLKTGKYYGIGEANLRYYSGNIISPPTVYVPADTPLWLQLVDLSAQYHVPISFHFVPEDTVANAAFEKMLNHNKNAIPIWCHLGFNNLPLNSTTLNDYLLRYPNLYFDTAGIQNMQNPLPQSNSNWARLTNESNNGRLNAEWKQFFETWNARVLFGSDAGGGSNGLERWLNYADNSVDGAPSNAIGHWRRLFSNLDQNAARNILSGNSRALFLKEPKYPYSYSVSSDGKCYTILISSSSSVSGLRFDQNSRSVTFTVADSIATAGSATIMIPTGLLKGNFTALVDGQSMQIKETPNSADTIIDLEYTGGIRTVVLSASDLKSGQ